MSMRYPAGFIRPGYDPLKNPDAPTAVTPTAGDASASVAFTPPANVGGSAISAYNVIASTGGTFVSNTSGVSPPVSVTGLTNGTAYTFQVWALNTYGSGPFSAASGSVTPASIRGLFGGGATTGNVSSATIDYIAIASTGNAASFGNLTVARRELGACASSSRGLFGGGTTDSYSNVIDYVTIASTGNAIDFGDLVSTSAGVRACSSSTRGVFGAAYRVLQSAYVTIASTGNATDFGALTVARYEAASCASPVRGIFCGGGGDGVNSSGYYNIIDYITIATTGNAIDFGDLSSVRQTNAACSSATRGIIAGGLNAVTLTNVIQYVTIATTGNAIDFGDLLSETAGLCGTSSSIRGVFAGANNVIQYITIASTGDSLDFGDLTIAKTSPAACSNAHGGLA